MRLGSGLAIAKIAANTRLRGSARLEQTSGPAAGLDRP
jgi:hypothetical protein